MAENENNIEVAKILKEQEKTALGADVTAENEAYYTSEKQTLASHYGTTLSIRMVLGFLINTAMMIYSHFGVSGSIKLSIPPRVEIDINEVFACLSQQDENVFLTDSDLTDTPNVVSFATGALCFGRPDIVECFIETLSAQRNLTSGCSSCYAEYADCLQNTCLNICRNQALNQAGCEACADQLCEFELEKCTGRNVYVDATTDACLANNEALQLDNEFSLALSQFAFDVSQDCASSSTDSLCRKELFLEEGPPREDFDLLFFTDDCLKCLDSLSECLGVECAAECASSPEQCELCALTSECGQDYNTCSGLNRYPEPIARMLKAPHDADRFLQDEEILIPPVIIEGDCILKNFSMFERLELTFVNSVQKALDGGSLVLGLLIGIASGIWPYVKNIMMAVAWFAPLRPSRRHGLLRTLGVLGKWSLVDVFAVVLIANGILIQKVFKSGNPFVLILEPRPGIYFFGFAAIWALAQGEVIHYYEQEFYKHREALMPHQDKGHFPLPNEQLNYRKKKGLLAALSALALVTTGLGVYLKNLELDTIGVLSNATGPTKYSYNVFELGVSLFDDCAIYDQHESQTGAFFLGLLFIFLVVAVPIISAAAMFLASLKFKITDDSNAESTLIRFALSVGNFAALDVWMVTLGVFSNQFAGLIRGAVGGDNVCGLSEEEEAAGIVCIGLEGSLREGFFFLLAASFFYWFAQCLAVHLDREMKYFMYYHKCSEKK